MRIIDYMKSHGIDNIHRRQLGDNGCYVALFVVNDLVYHPVDMSVLGAAYGPSERIDHQNEVLGRLAPIKHLLLTLDIIGTREEFGNRMSGIYLYKGEVVGYVTECFNDEYPGGVPVSSNEVDKYLTQTAWVFDDLSNVDIPTRIRVDTEYYAEPFVYGNDIPHRLGTESLEVLAYAYSRQSRLLKAHELIASKQTPFENWEVNPQTYWGGKPLNGVITDVNKKPIHLSRL